MPVYDAEFRLKVVQAYITGQPRVTQKHIAGMYNVPASTISWWVLQYAKGQLDDLQSCKPNSPHSPNLKSPLKEILWTKLEYHENQIRQIRQALLNGTIKED